MPSRATESANPEGVEMAALGPSIVVGDAGTGCWADAEPEPASSATRVAASASAKLPTFRGALHSLSAVGLTPVEQLTGPEVAA